ncbi:MAG: aldo/keto reductase [Spirochaetales bacterium]|nr:aldo/keto reductase [Spirochaetales bacterium]
MSNQTVDPASVPYFTLAGGDKIPAIGLGTFGSDHVSPVQVAETVKAAIKMGYRHIDCASVYGNEKEIGEAFKEVFDEGIVSREQLWITSKLWNDMHGKGDVLLSCAQTLKDLGLDYLDLYLVHWPFPNYHPPGCDVESRSKDAKPYIHEKYMETWYQMERLVAAGLVKNIGTSNMTIPKMKLVLRDAKIKPVCNEMELHPNFQQPELFNFIKEQGIQPIGFSPIGSPARPERDRTAEDTVDIEDPAVKNIAEAHNIHPAVVCLKWAYKRGQLPIPFSTKERNLYSNLMAVVEDPLTNSEMKELEGADKGCRLIKGQVFLWEGSNGWEDLWDADGIISGV